MKIRTLQNFQNLLFCLILFLLPTQLGKHFWFDFSYVSGIKIDYLSPTLYVTDILLVILLVLWFLNNANFFLKKIFNSGTPWVFSIFKKNGIILFATSLLFVDLLVGAILSENLWRSLFGTFKIFEMIFFGLYVWKSTVSFKTIVIVFLCGVLFQSVISLLQIFNQGSINGIFYFLGERNFSASTPGIANASISGQLFLRPYGTLPHPNVLAAYLLIAVELLIVLKNKTNRFLLFVPFVLLSVSLLLSLSRVAIILWVFVILSYAFIVRKRFAILTLILLIVVAFNTPLASRFLQTTFLEEAFVNRASLINASFKMIMLSPVFGIGVLQFIPTLPSFLSGFSFANLQPVHNIYLLVFSEAGAIGLAIFLWFILQTFFYISRRKDRAWRFLLLFTVLALGFLDHYFFTLQQGQLLLVFVFGLLWKEKAL